LNDTKQQLQKCTLELTNTRTQLQQCNGELDAARLKAKQADELLLDSSRSKETLSMAAQPSIFMK
jgi:hypothetical protein